jgi:hypothetical protein
VPTFQAMAERLNERFSSAGVGTIDPGLFAPGQHLADGLEALGVVTNPAERAWVEAWPAALLESVRALLHEDLTRAAPLAVSWVWMAGYDYRLTFAEAPGTPATRGGISVLVETRYPADPHPAVA